MKDEYPLEAVRTVREGARESAGEHLAAAQRVCERAALVVEGARRRLEDFRREERARMAREESRLGACTAAALQREAAFREERARHERALVSALVAARVAEREAVASASRARDALARACAELGALDLHHERWQRDQVRAEERAREDEADDSRPRRS